MAIVFGSDWLDFGANESTPVVVQHNLGRCPEAIGFTGKDGEDLGFPTLLDGEGKEIPGPRIEGHQDPNQLSVYKPDAYTFTGQFKITIYEK